MLGKVAAAGAIIWFVMLAIFYSYFRALLSDGISNRSFNIALFCTSPAFVFIFFLTEFHYYNFKDFKCFF